MARLILFLMLFAALALALASAVAAFRAIVAAPAARSEDPMPGAMRTVAYVVLLLLLLGAAGGLLPGFAGS